MCRGPIPSKLSATSTGTPRERVVLNHFLEREKQKEREIATFETPEINSLQKKEKKKKLEDSEEAKPEQSLA